MNQGWRVVLIAIVFEGSLGLAGWGLCAWLDVPLAPRLMFSQDFWWRTVMASVPMLLLLAYVTRTRWKPLVELRNQVESLVGEFFRGVSWPGLAAVSIAAGVGEEVLFRGALQPLAERWWGPVAGLLTASLLFGLVHAVTRTYFVFATLVGLYLGILAAQFDDLAAPIAVHAIYDFVALLVLQRGARRTSTRLPCEAAC
jgi:membrane protease YdiL (CAAX protease family)